MDTLSQAKDLFLTALQHQNQGELEQAETLYKRALELVPGRPSVINNLTAVLLQLKRYDEARSWCESLLATDPRNAVAILNSGNCQLALKNPDAALKLFEDALAIRADYAEAHSNRGEALQHLGRHEEALVSYDAALAIKPDFAGALSNRAITLQSLGRYEEALADFAHALALQPDHRGANLNESVCRLLTGDLARGWEKYEWRWHDDDGRISRRSDDFPTPLWDGTFVDGTLLAWGEQGLGDQILHAGMLDDLRSCAKQLLVEVEPRLVKLFERSFPGITVITRQPNYDAIGMAAHTALGSIGRYLRNDWKDFPVTRSRYLVADESRAALLRRKYAGDGLRLVGLSWLSKVDKIGTHKSARLKDFEPILRLPGIRFVNLQYGDTRDERVEVRKSFGAEVIDVHEVDNFHDIDGLAALISACDAVVTVSNTTAHIAGAIGTPTHVLLPYAHGTLWYWHVGLDRSPWYPSIRMFRQPAVGDWEGVIRQAAQELSLS
jgi:tetratricopeptide (TPR) repeat protein